MPRGCDSWLAAKHQTEHDPWYCPSCTDAGRVNLVDGVRIVLKLMVGGCFWERAYSTGSLCCFFFLCVDSSVVWLVRPSPRGLSLEGFHARNFAEGNDCFVPSSWIFLSGRQRCLEVVEEGGRGVGSRGAYCTALLLTSGRRGRGGIVCRSFLRSGRMEGEYFKPKPATTT